MSTLPQLTKSPANKSSGTRITELANIILESTAVVNDYLTSHGLPTPSFDVSGPSNIDFPTQEKEVVAAQIRVLGATNELYSLMQGPTSMLMEISVSSATSTTLHTLTDSN